MGFYKFQAVYKAKYKKKKNLVKVLCNLEPISKKPINSMISGLQKIWKEPLESLQKTGWNYRTTFWKQKAKKRKLMVFAILHSVDRALTDFVWGDAEFFFCVGVAKPWRKEAKDFVEILKKKFEL